MGGFGDFVQKTVKSKSGGKVRRWLEFKAGSS